MPTPDHLVRVAWKSRGGFQSKAHYTADLNKAICDEWLGEGFVTVPETFGQTCAECEFLATGVRRPGSYTRFETQPQHPPRKPVTGKLYTINIVDDISAEEEMEGEGLSTQRRWMK